MTINPKRGEVWLINLSKQSSADTLQLRSVDLQRFVRKLGLLSPSDLQSIIIAIVTVIEYEESTQQ